MNRSDPITISELCLLARKKLKVAGVSMPELEARELAARAALIRAHEVVPRGGMYVPEAAVARLDALLERRFTGIPLAYLLGEWDFLDITLKITPDVLIPRSDTEILALEAIERCREAGPEPRLLDLCCGSGCIGLAVADRLPDARITFCDISESAMKVARENCRTFGGLFSLVTADALEIPPTALRGFDVVACNPPYVTDAEWGTLDREVRDYEPKLALAGGTDGLDFYHAVSNLWRGVLAENGSLLFEVGHTQAYKVAEIMRSAGFADIIKIPDLSGIERVVAGRNT